MNDSPKWKVARLDEIERRGSFIPVREYLGIHSFGINVRTAGEDGTLINEHDEGVGGQEEVYVVLEGTATLRDRRRDVRRAGRDVRVGPARGTAQGDRRRDCPCARRHGR